MANNKSATPAQRVAQKYNYKLRQLKGIEAQLGLMQEGRCEDSEDDLHAQLVNIWVDHCLRGVEELRERIQDSRNSKIKKAKEQQHDRQ